MAKAREEAEKAFRLAEERFLAGDLDAALRVSRNATKHFGVLPALKGAHAAYEVHAAACGASSWYPVLGVRGPARIDALKKQYKHMCLVLHPDKNRSAAAEGAFKLLQQAWDAISSGNPSREKEAPPPHESEWYWWWSEGSRRGPPPRETGPPPPPFDLRAWRAAYARRNGNIYCGHCYVGGAWVHGKSAGRCHARGAAPHTPPPESPPPLPPRHRDPPPRQSGSGGEFTCPAGAECPRCGARFSSLVDVGLWSMRCQACSYDAVVHVRSRDMATAF